MCYMKIRWGLTVSKQSANYKSRILCLTVFKTKQYLFRFTWVGSLRSYDGNCNENFILKFNFALSYVFCDYFMLVTLYKIGEVHFRFLGTNGFHVKEKNEWFNTVSLRCRLNLKYENFTSSFGWLRQNIAPKSVPHVQHDYFSSFNQSNHWFVALPLPLPSSNLKFPSGTITLNKLKP